MSIRNVGIVFSPTLKIPSPVFSMFLTDFESIFGDEYKEEPTATFELSISEPLTPEDIRSPRHQILSDIPTPSYHQATFPKQEPSYEQKMHTSRIEHDMGFIPLQPSYEPPSSRVSSYDQPSHNSIVPGPEYNATSRKSNANSAAKARRRESSMLMMGSGPTKSSMPGSSGDSGE